jgi:hypothetical protein
VLVNNLVSVIALITLSACTTAPTNPIATDPVVTAKSANSFEIEVTGLTGKKAIDVERGFHDVADEACRNKAGWSGWKMSDGTQIKPTKNSADLYVAKGLVVCSR